MVGRHVLRLRRGPHLSLALVAVAFIIGGCGGDDGDDAGSPRTTATSASSITTTTVEPDKAAVSAAYEAASRAFIEAAAIPDPDFPAIADTHTGPMLEQTHNLLRALRMDGRFIRYPANSRYQIGVERVDVTGDVARMSACVVDDGERVDRATGNVIAGGVVTVRWTAAMRRVDGTWRLAERREEARWDGVAGCAAG